MKADIFELKLPISFYHEFNIELSRQSFSFINAHVIVKGQI